MEQYVAFLKGGQCKRMIFDAGRSYEYCRLLMQKLINLRLYWILYRLLAGISNSIRYVVRSIVIIYSLGWRISPIKSPFYQLYCVNCWLHPSIDVIALFLHSS